MQSGFASRGGSTLLRTPSPRQQARRRWLVAVCAMAALAIASGLIGCGHPVGATGTRMLLDAAKQVTGRAGECQIEGAQRMQTLNIGGSCATVVSFVVARGD